MSLQLHFKLCVTYIASIVSLLTLAWPKVKHKNIQIASKRWKTEHKCIHIDKITLTLFTSLPDISTVLKTSCLWLLIVMLITADLKSPHI